MKLEVFDKHTRLRIAIINAFTYVKYEDDYCGTGSFEITIPTIEESLDYLTFGNYIFFETGVLGVIKGVTDTEDSDVEVKVYGYLTNHILQYRSFLLTTKYYDSIGNIARQMVTDLFINPRDSRRRINYVTLSSDPRYIPIILGNVTVQNTGSTLFDVLNEIFLQYDLGFELYPVLENTNNGSMLTELQFRIITPVDRTINNTHNNVPVVFSFDLDNLQSLEYEEDGRAYNNVAIVASEGEGETRKILEVGDRAATGIDRIELYIDARDIQYDSGTLALEEIDSLEDSLQDVATSGEYSDLYNVPSINGHELIGNKTSAELGIITETVNNLTNYYLKSQTYTQAEVNTLINNALNGVFEIVATLPTQDISTHTIYLVPASTTATNNYYDEYMYINNQWELIGSTQIDLSNYVTTQSLNTTLANYVTTQSLNTTLASYVTSQSLNNTLANYPTNTALEGVTGDLSDLETADKSDLVAAINEIAQSEKIQYAIMPIASADNVGDIVQYVGATTASYINGYFYKCSGVSGEPLPYNFKEGSAVVYNNEIHLLGGSTTGTENNHYKWDGLRWVSVSTLPYIFYWGSAVVYNGEIHILGSEDDNCHYNHYKWDGTSWTQVSTLPRWFYEGSAVVYNNEIHIIGGQGYTRYHNKWNGTSWTELSRLPVTFIWGSAVIYDNAIHCLGADNQLSQYKWDGTSWSLVSALPYDFSEGSAVVLNNAVHMLGGNPYKTKHSVWNGSAWSSLSDLPIQFYDGDAVIYNGEIHIFTGTNHYKWDGTGWTSLIESSYAWARIDVQPSSGGGTTVEQLFVATYGVTTYADIETAYNAGKLIVVSRELNGITWYIFTDRTAAGVYYFRSFSNATATNYGCYIDSSGTWSVNSYTYATLSSPAFTGTPTAPTAASGTNTTQIATTAFVQDALSSISGAAFYAVDLNNGQWARTDTVIDKGHVYKSTNEGIQSSAYSCTISIIGFTSFTIMARSNGESNYDYAEIGALDAATITRNSSTNVKTFKGSPSTTYTAVTFDNLDGGFHTIKVLYSKDSSVDSNEDAGFFYIPNQLGLNDLISGGGSGSIATSAEISAIANRTFSS